MSKRKQKKVEKGKRLSVWVSEKDYWMFHALESMVRKRESIGMPCSKSDVIREILKERLEKVVL